jgi:ribosomal-protein-alanine N-acetyltransferase
MKLPQNITLKTERLFLRKPKMSDAKEMVGVFSDKHSSKFTHIPYPYRLKDAKDFLKMRLPKFGKDHYEFFITLAKTKEIIGSAGFVSISKRDNRGEVGYYISPKHRKKGYATEACKAVLDFGFKKLKLHRININHIKGNKASQKVIKKMGAKYEGTEREGSKPADGKYKDTLLYAILDREWKKKK